MPSRRGRTRLVAAIFGLLATIALFIFSTRPPSLEDWKEGTAARYESFWQSLEKDAEAAAVKVEPLLQEEGTAAEQRFQVLAQIANESARPRFAPTSSFLLLNPDSDAVAWAGKGLQHEPLHSAAAEGRFFTRGVTATTLWVQRTIRVDKRNWHLVVGASFADTGLAFSPYPLSSATKWSVVSSGSGGEAIEVSARGGGPPLRIENLSFEKSPVLGDLGFLMLLAGAVLLPRLLFQRGFRLPRMLPAPFASAVFFLLAGAVFWAHRVGFFHSSDQVPGETWAVLAMILHGTLLITGIHLSSKGEPSREAASFRPLLAGGALISIVAAAGTQDRWWLSLLLGALGCFLLAKLWGEAGRFSPFRLSAVGAFILCGAIVSAASWQAIARESFRQDIEGKLLQQISPPTANEQNHLLTEVQSFFDQVDVASFLPVEDTEPTDLQDMAFAIWRQSPLAERGGLSALTLSSLAGEDSSFSLGLPLDAQLNLQVGTFALWPVPASPIWQEALISGEALLSASGKPWGQLRYWFQPRPGFSLAGGGFEDLRTDLIRGRKLEQVSDGLPAEIRYALYELDGRVISSPWPDSDSLPKDALAKIGQRGTAETPAGKSWIWLNRGIDGLETLFLPVVGFRDGLERSGFQALIQFLGTLLLLGLIILNRSSIKDAAQIFDATISSYSKRLILVYSTLLLLPLVALNLVLLQDFRDRLRTDQLESAQAAMSSARTLLVNYLRGLEPGFLIDTIVNRELLEWISGLVGHQVNVYWGSQVYASSQDELFTAGLLPRRIPAEVYSRLAFEGSQLGYRRQRAGDATYLEVYAPFDLVGDAYSQQGLFLSVPLVEQEAEAAQEVATMQKRALLTSLTLLCILGAVSSWLAKKFTEPIVDLIEDTRRISQGRLAQSPPPKELELRSLAEAIEVMSRNIAESRQRLLLEKEFIELVVANIASGVVSLDGDLMVIRQNGVAAAMLGTEIGDHLPVRLDSQPFTELVDFVGQASSRGRAATQRVRIRRDDGETLGIDEWNLVWVPLEGNDPAALLVIDDVTEILRGQRLEAWAEMARIIAHEIKNPLTPIRLATEHLQQVYATRPEAFAPVFDRCTANILKNVQELQVIASEFSLYSRIPQAHLETEDLVQVVRDLVASYSDLGQPSARVVVESDCEIIRLRLDRRLIGRALRNLLENSLRAQGSSGLGEIQVRIRSSPGWAHLQVVDNGPGVDPQKLPRIFEPYFSTHETGTGLGLAITKQIVEEHGGRISAANRPQGGFFVELSLPTEGENLPAEKEG